MNTLKYVADTHTQDSIDTTDTSSDNRLEHIQRTRLARL